MVGSVKLQTDGFYWERCEAGYRYNPSKCFHIIHIGSKIGGVFGCGFVGNDQDNHIFSRAPNLLSVD